MNGNDFWAQSNGQPQTHGDIMDAFKVKQHTMANSYRSEGYSSGTAKSLLVSLPGWLKLAVLGALIVLLVDKLPV
ncbi:MAG TPA: hypothetical protein VFF14_04565 [Candidatus Deferrimicrobium sp.]|nr:hypothetical protein [Candidatus Deferrimicrobium sp.]